MESSASQDKDIEITCEEVGDTNKQLVISIKALLESTPPLPSESCIYRVPNILRCVNEEAYTPKIVSVGPLHHGKDLSHAMEVHKQRYLKDFLTQSPNTNLEECVEALRNLEERARNCYAESISIRSNDFIKIMLLDGCFVVELVIKSLYPRLRNKDDPIFKTYLMRNELRRDMLLIENQLPFFILEHLFDLMNVPVGQLNLRYSFLELASDFFEDLGQGFSLGSSTYEVKHFVGLLTHCYLPKEARIAPKSNVNVVFIPTITELHEAGVKFKKNTSSKCFLDVKFINGILKIPILELEDLMESRLRNLIALEQCHNGSTRYISDYVILMDCLIDTPNDVTLLRNCGIINNLLGNNEEVSQLFSKLSSGVGIDPNEFYFSRLFEDVNAYYNTRWHAWKAKLKRDFFNTPWAIVSFVAAGVLLILAFTQAVCSIISLKA